MPTRKEVFTRKVTDEDELDRSHVFTEEESPVGAANRVVMALLSFIEGVLALRLVLSLFGANRGNAFADFIYDLSSPLVAPFRGLFNIESSVGTGVGRFEFEVAVAMLIYALLGWIISSILSVPRQTRYTH